MVKLLKEIGIRYLPAHEVEAAVNANQGTSSHVPNEAVVFDGNVAFGRASVGGNFWVHAVTNLWLYAFWIPYCQKRGMLHLSLRSLIRCSIVFSVVFGKDC
jgi:hypothetical protein